MNPYVTQMDRFSDTLRHLSHTFLSLDTYKGTFTVEEVEQMYHLVTTAVCGECSKRFGCQEEGMRSMKRQMYDVLGAIETYGAELNIETRRKIQKRCVRSDLFLQETLDVFRQAKQKLLWNNKIAQNREGCAIWLKEFADILQKTTRDLESSIFLDEHLEKKIKTQMKKIGVKVWDCVFMMTPKGQYTILLTVKSCIQCGVSTKQVASVLSRITKRKMVLKKGTRGVIGKDYCEVECIESSRFYTLQGVAKIGKEKEMMSGDTFAMISLPGGREGIVLSDGMGSGEEAFLESARVVEMIEELLEAGVPVEAAIQMMNTVLVMGREELRFSTMDVCVFDLYEGELQIMKAGASATFLRTGQGVEKIVSTTLPIGVIQNLEIACVERKLEDGDLVIMMTDGVMDSFQTAEQEGIVQAVVAGIQSNNPKEISRYLLEQVLKWTGNVPPDDMTVIVIGIWKM